MRHVYYVLDPQKALPLLSLKMMTSYSFKPEELENGIKTYGWIEFDGELSAKCIEISGVQEKEVDTNEKN